MIRETTADIIRRRRGMKPMDDVNDGLMRAPEPQVVPLGVEAGFENADTRRDGATSLQNLSQWSPVVPQPEAEAVEPIRDPELEQMAAEVTQPRPGSIPGQVAQSVTAAAPSPDTRDDDEMWAAQEADRKSHLTAGMELAARQLVGGITQTPVSQGLGAAPSRVPAAQHAAKSRREQAAEAIRLKRQGVQDERALAEDKSQAKLRDAQIAHYLREKKGGKGAGSEEEVAGYKAMILKRYGDDPKRREIIDGLTTMKGLQDFQNGEEGDLTRASNERVGDKAAYRANNFRKEATEEAQAEAARKKMEDEAKALGNEMKGRGVMSKRLKDLEATIPSSGSVPGTGIMGDAIAWFDSKAGTDFQSPEAIKIRQNIGLLMAAILREQSGATVSEQEYARAVQNGLSTKNAATTRAALKRLHEEFNLSEKEIRSKYSPEAIKTYEGRAAAQGGGKPSPGPGYVRGAVDGQPGWINKTENDFVAD